MLFHLTFAERLGRIAGRLQSTDAVTAGLVSEIVSECCARLPVSGQGRASAHLRELLEAGAWTDAVVMLMEIRHCACSCCCARPVAGICFPDGRVVRKGAGSHT